MLSDFLFKKFPIRVAGDQGDGEGEKEKEKGSQGTGDNEDEDEDDQDEDLSPEEYKKQIKKLRAENAKHRLGNKALNEKMSKFEKVFKAFSGDDEEVDPEEQLGQVTHQYEAAVTRNAILELALENGISGKDNLEYFEFLMSKTLNSLDEGEEMTEEQLEEILSKCSKAGGKGKATTSTNDKGKGDKDPDQTNDEVTQEEFDSMGMMQKSKLYQTNKALYEKLMKNSKMR